MSLQVFISHAVADGDIAAAIQEWIRQTFLGGISVFVSSNKSIAPGEDWRASIETALKNADIILVVCTQHSLSRPWVGFEAGAGWMKGAKVVPLCYHGVEPASLPLPFSSRQALDLGNDDDIKQLLDLLVKDAQFDPQSITQKPIPVPQRRSQESDSGSKLPDVRVHVGAYRYGSPGYWRDIIQVTAENHGDRIVYLSGGVCFEMRETSHRLACLSSCIDNQGFYDRELHPGQAVKFPVDPANMKPEDRLRITRAFVTDQIGRQYFSSESEMKDALEKWNQHL